jgi:hypothetical protein
MDILIIIILLLLVTGVTSVLTSLLRNSRERIVTVPKRPSIEEQTTLDIQFGEKNFPSEIHGDMFANSSPWIGGYELGSGKTYIVESKSK